MKLLLSTACTKNTRHLKAICVQCVVSVFWVGMAAIGRMRVIYIYSLLHIYISAQFVDVGDKQFQVWIYDPPHIGCCKYANIMCYLINYDIYLIYKRINNPTTCRRLYPRFTYDLVEWMVHPVFNHFRSFSKTWTCGIL